MRIRSILNKKGVTLIELLVALVIAAITMAGIYRVFISQTKNYAIQDQVMEVQQSVRGAMEILLRDLRMTGFDDDNVNSKYNDGTLLDPVIGTTPITTPLSGNSVTVRYEYFDRTIGASGEYQLHTITYAVDGSSNLVRTRTVKKSDKSTVTTWEILLPNVTGLTFTYGVDSNPLDGVMDDQNGDGIINASDYLAYNDPKISASPKVVAIRVTLTGRPDQTNTDVSKVVSPRTLISAVTLRNLSLR
jgi:prepilin-type N-terminal cleavage/methylation domain-containing protein